MSDVCFYKNKLDQLLTENRDAYQKAGLSPLMELLKKMVVTIDDEIEQLKRKQKSSDF